jgi:hypothetical protein
VLVVVVERTVDLGRRIDVFVEREEKRERARGRGKSHAREELPRFENSRNVKMIAPSVILPRFRNSENVKTTALTH